MGHVTAFSYTLPDGSGNGGVGALINPTEIQYPTFTQLQRYDSLERPTTQTVLNPWRMGLQNLVGTLVYDKRGQVASKTNANGNTHQLEYSALGQLIQITDSLGRKTKAQYDALGNLIQIADANGNVNKFGFDRNSRMVSETLPLGQINQYEYDLAGNLVRSVDANGHQRDYQFDPGNRLIEVKMRTSGGVLTRTISYTWNAEDRLTAWRDTDHDRNQVTSAALTYDEAGRKTEEAMTYPGGTSLSYRYSYSHAGYVTRLTWADGTAIDYAYSAHGQLQSVSIPGEGSITVSEYKWAEPAQIILPGGGTQNRSVDGLLHLEDLEVKTPTQQTVLSLSNTWGKAQELKSQVRGDTSVVTTIHSRSFTYDDETRLVESQTEILGGLGSYTEQFTLDRVGNRVGHSKVQGPWSYDANNRLIRIGDGACGEVGVTCYSYDETGNLTQKQTAKRTMQYRYDLQNRLVQVQDIDAGLVARYGYDPLDRRIWKEQFRDAYGEPLQQALRTYYFYSDEGLLAEAIQPIALQEDGTAAAGSDPQITTQYGFRPGGDWGTGPLFIKTRNSNGKDGYAYFHHDQLNTPMQATNANGDVVWSARYDAFGRVSITTPQSTEEKPTIIVRLRLGGQYEDSETGLHYNFHRYYDPDIGRYTQSDPVSLRGGINRYQYVGGNPLSYIDPTGLWSKQAHNKIFEEALASCGASDKDILAMQTESDAFDRRTGLGVEGANWHSMRKPFQRRANAIRGRDEFIEDQISSAQSAYSNDDGSYIEFFARAAHTAQDSTSPVHVNDAGVPYVWPTPWNAPLHGNSPLHNETERDLDDPKNAERRAAAIAKTRELWERVTGKPCRCGE